MFPNTSAARSGASNIGRVPDNPGLLRQWLKQQLSGTLPDRISILTDLLSQMREKRGTNRRYLDCLDVVVDFVNPMSITASERYSGQPPPIPARSIELSEQMSALWSAVADCYKAFVLDSARDENRDIDAMKASRACYAAIYSYGRVLFSAYEVYRRKPDDVLREIHQLYLYARANELLSLGQRSMIADFDGVDTILDTYKRILLLDIADPYQMPFKMVVKADDMLTRLVDFASLRNAPLNDEIKGIFLIDPSTAQSGVPQLSQHLKPLHADCQLLCTLPLIARVHSHIDLLLSTGAGEWINPEKSARQVDYINMLRSLVVKLGVQPIRQGVRHEADNECNIAVGAQRLALIVHDKVPNLGIGESDELDTVVAKNARTVFSSDRAVATNPQLTRAWVVIDETTAGMQLETETPAQEQMSVGELIGIEQSNRQRKGWTVGVIRWIKNKSDSHGNLGILKLGWPAMPALARRPEDTGASVPCIMLPANEELRRNECLVMPKGYYKLERRLLINIENINRQITMRELIISSASGDCFEIEMINADSTGA